jgi:hypothetical protein
VGVPTYPLGFIMGSILLAGGVYWLAYARPRRAGAPALAPAEGVPEQAQAPLDEAPVR